MCGGHLVAHESSPLIDKLAEFRAVAGPGRMPCPLPSPRCALWRTLSHSYFTLSPNSNRRHLPSGAPTFPAMGEEEIGAARRAIVSDQDVLRLDPRARELMPGHGG